MKEMKKTNRTEVGGFDVIGDIHGYATRLRGLLEMLGYAKRDGCYRHPERKVIFVGDFIDRGPEIRETLRMVKAMVDGGAALAVAGNHELNALCYHTPAPGGGWLRERSEKNRLQHAVTLDAFAAHPGEWAGYLDWFKTLPLWLDLPGLRVVHACWDESAIAVLGDRTSLEEPLLLKAAIKGSPEYHAVEVLLKGREIRLPDGYLFDDGDGYVRDKIRTKWWMSHEAATYRELVWPDCPTVPALPVPAGESNGVAGYGEDAAPVFFGHYWLPPAQVRLAGPNLCCLDFSVAKGGPLMAYRWDGEQCLDHRKFAAHRGA